jgi:hypothetical protein
MLNDTHPAFLGAENKIVWQEYDVSINHPAAIILPNNNKLVLLLRIILVMIVILLQILVGYKLYKYIEYPV